MEIYIFTLDFSEYLRGSSNMSEYEVFKQTGAIYYFYRQGFFTPGKGESVPEGTGPGV